MTIREDSITAIQTVLNLQFQTNNRFFPLEETIEDWNEAENGDQEAIYPDNNITTRQKSNSVLEQNILLRKTISKQLATGKDVFQRIVDIGLYWKECGVKDVIISSTLVKRNSHLTRII